ncbi:MAG: pyridoxamine 5'-phosphate oxidase, partial [Candidatus Rokuibacteriota bacterium]
MSRHAGPPRATDAPSIPEPTFAERARTLAYLGLTGALATLSRRHPGHPFASVMPYALDDAGAPLFLISTMAMHTQNLEADARASLLITQPGWSGDPLAAARLTLMGEARRVPEATVAAARERYLARHERARYWADFEDFALWRLQVTDLYFVGGFA